MGAEWIGICNFSWLLYGTVSHLLCHKVRRVQATMDSQKTLSTKAVELMPQSPTELNRGPNYDSGMPAFEKLTWFDYLKYIWSTAVTLGSVICILYGIGIKAYVLPTPVPVAYFMAIFLLTVLFYLEGLMIAVVATQYWDPETFRNVYPRAYHLHKVVNRPDNMKRFIIGRQFFTVLTNFLLAQIFTFANWPPAGIDPILYNIAIAHGVVGVFVILAFGQLLPELLAAEFPLRFMNMYGSCLIIYITLFFDSIGVGHCAWSIYYLTRSLCCVGHMEEGRVTSDSKPTLVRVQSAEVLAKTTPSMATV